MATTCNDLIDLSGDYPAIGKLTLTDDAPSAKPAPEPSGPNAPATPEELNVKVSADTLKRYADSLELIQTLTLDGVQLKAQQQHYKVQQLQRDIGKTNELLTKLMGVCAKEREQMDKLDDDKWYPGKLLKGKKAHTEKVEGQQAKLGKAEDELDKQRARLMQLQQDEQHGRAEAEALDKKVAQLLRAQEFEAAVVQQLFQGAGGDDKENELEQGAARSKQKLDGLAQYKTMYGKTEKILQSALSHATQAEQACEQASRMARADLAQDVFSPMPMMNGPAGIMIDASKHRAFQASAHHAAAAAQLVIEAKQLMPSMPEVDLPKMKKFLGGPGLGMDMVFDNAFTDVRSMRKIQDALSDVHDLRRDTEKALRWVQEWLHTRIDRDYDAAESTYRADKATLDEHRRALMQRMIAAL